ncbi:TPA: hypothetical protein DEP96_00030 [Candidatus Uhrbacteria bacterium]|nr:hypothetical protein [Candidatus Uhrbacteria bacterium]
MLVITSLVLRSKTWLSHHPLFYALLGGTGVVLFWRGAWHTVDYLMLIAQNYSAQTAQTSIDLANNLWWDGPLSLVVGSLILLFTGAFVSSLIGNEIIISGLRTEQRQLTRNDDALHNEARELEDLRQVLANLTAKIEHLADHQTKKTKKTS